MRRYERETNDIGGGRGFRIIEAGGRYLEPLTPPPPPRAPEPYKVVGSSSSLGRAHRRSSFVIIAETRPATPTSTSPSPTLLPTGRVSPFRGRGFKGPLPHAQSRPQSPENRVKNEGHHGRYDRRASVSQQSSPKRSLIPQPTRRRSVSLTKNNEVTKASPKFGRRAQVSRRNLNQLNNPGVNVSRRHSLKAPDLSPIQGTPTKPNGSSIGGRYGNGNSLVAKVSPLKTRNNLSVPKYIGNGRKTLSNERTTSNKTRRFVEEKKKTSSDDDARTKIPMRRGSIVGKNGPEVPTTRFLGNDIMKASTKVAKPKKDGSKQETDPRASKSLPGTKETAKNEKSSSEGSSGGRFIDVNSLSDQNIRENDLGLMDLLKQSSGAVGTSSVVNTTTTTAVQPLKIEAATILLEKGRDNLGNEKAPKANSPGAPDPRPGPGSSSGVNAESSTSVKVPKTSRNNQQTATGEKKIDARDREASGSSSISQSGNNPGRISSKGNGDSVPAVNPASKKEQNNPTSNGPPSRERNLAGATGGSRKNLLTRNGVQETNRGETRVSSAKPGTRGNNSSNGGTNNQKNVAREPAGSGKVESSVTVENVASGGVETPQKPPETVGRANPADNRQSDPPGDPRNEKVPATGERRLSTNVAGAKTTEITNDATVRTDDNSNDNNNKSRVNGSDDSLKSSNGLSAVSVESIRSTDTGVSVNTVRGVSSAREKKGMHMMKRSEEIETLSGNVMHLERNGEPAVLDIAEAPDEQKDQTRLGRLKTSLTRFRDRFSKMKCLGCRKNEKGQPWMGERGKRAPRRNEPTVTSGNVHQKVSRCSQFWASWKNSCRCTRLRECKCCKRAARVAPAESAPCCPPERRCGALCGRLLSCCKCNRSEAQHTRSIRAKHSLTSVAPPPISEEQGAKIPEVLVEHNSVMRGAIPCLPVPIAWFCLVWNVLLPGSGTVWSGLFNLCVGQPRFSISAGPRARFGALIVNLIVGVGQLFTVLFCLVGWGWSIWWGVTMIRLARKYKRFRASEAASNDLEARGSDQTALPPGVPSQALRGMERAR